MQLYRPRSLYACAYIRRGCIGEYEEQPAKPMARTENKQKTAEGGNVVLSFYICRLLKKPEQLKWNAVFYRLLAEKQVPLIIAPEKGFMSSHDCRV